MNTTKQHVHSPSGDADSLGAVHLLLTQGDVKLMAEDPMQVMEEIHFRAERVSSILQGILEPHGEPRWGINE